MHESLVHLVYRCLRRWCWRLGGCVLCLLALPLWGAGLGGAESLYQVRWPVSSQADSQREAAFTAGLETVLVRLTGDRGVAERPGVAQELASAHAYVEQFGYRQPAGLDGVLELEVRFSPRQVRGLMSRNRLPLWPARRPRLLVWLAVEDGYRRVLLRPGQQPEWFKPLATAASRRGLPLVFPVRAEDTRETVRVEDLWPLFPEAVTDLSEPYLADAVLAGRLVATTGGDWVGRWLLIDEAGARYFDLTAEQASGALGGAIDQVADLWAERYRLRGSTNPNAQLMVVEGVESAASFAALSGYLEALEWLGGAQLQVVLPTQLQFELVAAPDRQQMERLLGLDSQLVPVEPLVDGGASGDESMHYRWIGP
ncbi:MAG: DUF2066 domain-containing protein [Pseudomonadota bacterium]|nr:DUF2066 domain-containing protein [Pseudomonadota bacterium]